MRTRHLGLALPALVAAGLVAQPVTAFAADPVIPVIAAIGTVPGDPGLLTVQASSDSDVTSVHADLSRFGEAAASVDLHLTDGVWTSNRLVLDYGYYDVSITVTDADGDVAGGSDTLDYLKQPHVVSHSQTPTRLDALHPQLVSTGVVQYLDPRDGVATHPAANVTARLTVNNLGLDTTIGFDGRYTLRWTPNSAGGAPQVDTTLLMPDYSWKGSGAPVDGPVDVPVVSTYGRILLDAVPPTVRYPNRITLSGTVQAYVGGVWQPLPGAEVVSFGTGRTDSGVVRTSAAGRFSFTPAPVQDGTYGVRIPAGSTTAVYVGARTASAKVVVVDRTSLSWDSPSINEYSELHIAGLLRESSGDRPAKGTKVYAEQARDGKHWVSLGWVPTDANGAFSFEGYVPHPTGSFRLVYRGTSVLQPSVSRTVKLSRTETRVVKLNASPEPVRAGRTVHVTGTVQRRSGSKWVSIGKRQVVELFFRKMGSKTYTYKGYALTTSTGHFSVPAKATKDGYWSAVWFTGSTRYVNAYSNEDLVDVR